MIHRIAIFLSAAAAAFLTGRADACTRVLYAGPDGMVAVGRTFDWREDPSSNLFLFPRGVERRGGKSPNSVAWRSKYGSIAVSTYDVGTCDGMNERGLAASELFLPESSYVRENDNRPVLALSMWLQYVLDNFATVDEAVAELSRQRFRIDAPDLSNGRSGKLHLAISDPSGDSAIVEYIGGEIRIHHGPQYRVLTNSPAYPYQLAINDYWQAIGGMRMLPGTNRSSDRFVRASFYIGAVEQSADPAVALPALLSVVRNVSVPYGISSPEQPYASSTRWRVAADQKNRIYYYESTLGMRLLWVDLAQVDFSAGRPTLKLTLAGRNTLTDALSGNVLQLFRPGDLDFMVVN